MASNDTSTKAQRREAARAKARAMREEQERKERRARLTRRALIGAAVVGVAGVGTTMYVADSGNAHLSLRELSYFLIVIVIKIISCIFVPVKGMLALSIRNI